MCEPSDGGEKFLDRHGFAHDHPATGRVLQLPELVRPATDVHRRPFTVLGCGIPNEVRSIAIGQTKIDDQNLCVTVDTVHRRHRFSAIVRGQHVVALARQDFLVDLRDRNVVIDDKEACYRSSHR